MSRRFRVRLGEQDVVKMFPEHPPARGDIVLVDGVRCRVVRSKVRWREPGIWTLRRLTVKRAP